MPRNDGRKQWSRFVAILAKEGNFESARKIAGISRKALDATLAKYPEFKAKCDAACQAGRMASKVRVAGRSRGRPANAFTLPLRTALLDIYGETGSGVTACALCGVSLTSVRQLRLRDPMFARDWNAARLKAEWYTSELGLWREREALLMGALYAGVSRDDAARLAGISPGLVTMLASRTGLTQAQAKRHARVLHEASDNGPNRFRVAPQGARPQHVRAAPVVSRAASVAELEATNRANELDKAERRLTPEQRTFVASLADDSLTVEQARTRAGLSERQLAAWVEANEYIRFCTE